MQVERKNGKLLLVRNGYLVCPCCGVNKHLLRIRPGTVAKDLQVFCRICKKENIVDIEKGQCFESQGQ